MTPPAGNSRQVRAGSGKHGVAHTPADQWGERRGKLSMINGCKVEGIPWYCSTDCDAKTRKECREQGFVRKIYRSAVLSKRKKGSSNG